jgi:ATP-dependent Clp protease adapter protein ClpS
MKAVNCGSSQAYEMMMTAHNSGSAIVFTGGKERCELVASILEEIGLATSVEEA